MRLGQHGHRVWLYSSLVCLVGLGVVGCENDDKGDEVYVGAGDAADVVLSSGGAALEESGALETDEAGGGVEVDVALAAAPRSTVTLQISSSNTTEGIVSPAEVVFTPDDWATPQTLSATGVDDDIADGPGKYEIRFAIVTEDPDYAGIELPVVQAVNADDDVAGVSVKSDALLATTEAGGDATVSLVLESEPTADVVFAVTSSDNTEGSLSAATLTFTPANWSVAQELTVHGENDYVADGNMDYEVQFAVTSADETYDGWTVAAIAARNSDDDVPGVTTSLGSGSLLTTENDDPGTAITVVLDSEPTADVILDFTSTDVTEGTVLPATLTFTAANWKDAQVVTVTGENDDVDDGDWPYEVQITPTSDDALYAALNIAPWAALNSDDDTVGVSVTPTSLKTHELGTSDTFSVVLESEPIDSIVIRVWTGEDTTEGELSHDELTFDASNWDQAQEVTVTGLSEAGLDGDVTYEVLVDMEDSGTDTLYGALDPDNVSVLNEDLVIRPLSRGNYASNPQAGGGLLCAYVGRSDLLEGGDGSLFYDTSTDERTDTGYAYEYNGHSISDDGAFLALTERRWYPDESSQNEVVVLDRVNDSLTVASVSTDGRFFGDSTDPSLSADGNRVAFTLSAELPALLDDVPLGFQAESAIGYGGQIYVRDINAALTTQVDVTIDDEPANGPASEGDISADGAFVVFSSWATDIDARATGGDFSQIYSRDMAQPMPALASLSFDGTAEANNSCYSPAVSGDGQFVAYASNATNIIDPATDSTGLIFLRDTVAGTNELISQSSTGIAAAGWSDAPSISDDGNIVAFVSADDTMEPEDDGSNDDVFVRNRALGVTRVVSIFDDTSPRQFTGCFEPSVSADGRMLLMTCWERNESQAVWLVELDDAFWTAPVRPPPIIVEQ